jgi:NAD(P)-dependent dehydrogenase (short-subunit alcohol dehydrogenase family)
VPTPDQPAVLVTGASTGIGWATVECLVQDGCLVFAGVRREEDGDRVHAAFRDRVHPIRLDVTSAEDIESARQVVLGQLGGRGLVGLVNNAGIAIGGPLEYITPEMLRKQLEVNVVGLHATTRAFLGIVRQGKGRIVHIGSISGRIGSPFIGPYAASKHAVEALTDALRLELMPEGIHVAVIEPGQVRTPIWDKGVRSSGSISEQIPPDGMARYQSRLRAFRFLLEQAPRHAIEAREVARAVRHALFAPDPKTRYVLGRDARLRLLLWRVLPNRVMDALVARFFTKLEQRAP